MLQTYFGDVRDCYSAIDSLAFDGIGLDFMEGKKTLELIEKNGFASGKLLFAGVVTVKIFGGTIIKIRLLYSMN